MKRTRFTDEQIIGVLAEHEAGAKCADLCRKHGMSEGVFYNWKARCGGITVSEAKRLKALEDENAKLKKLLAEQMLDLAAMKDLVSKKWCRLARPFAELEADLARQLGSTDASPGSLWFDLPGFAPIDDPAALDQTLTEYIALTRRTAAHHGIE